MVSNYDFFLILVYFSKQDNRKGQNQYGMLRVQGIAGRHPPAPPTGQKINNPADSSPEPIEPHDQK